MKIPPIQKQLLGNVRVIAKYPVRILHFAELGVMLGALLAIGIHSWQEKQQPWERIVREDMPSLEPSPTPSPSTLGGEVNPDRDGDGIPNEWETLFHHDPDEAADAGADFDNDGLTTLQEYQLHQQTNGQSGNPLGKWRVETFAQPNTQNGSSSWPVDINNQGLILVQTGKEDEIIQKQCKALEKMLPCED